jgi:cytochrome c-type biogenesis protein CcmH/NrfG
MCLKIAQMAAEDRKPDLMEAALLQYTETVPADMRGWIDLAGIQFVLNKQETAFVSLRQAVKIGKESAITILREDPRFQAVRTLPAFQQLLAPR